jgi:murein DD-endopeptidase MepM/ murein hydrolase activator NlpD
VTIEGDAAFSWPGGSPVGDGVFAWPVGQPPGAGWYDIQPFGTNRHLGADLNADAGTRVGDPVYAAGDGCVVFAQDIWRGWGNVVRVVHPLPDGSVVETLYAHLDRIDTAVGAWITRGTLIGTVGTAHGTYGPHLHLEVRTTVGLPQGPGYGWLDGYTDPIVWIAEHDTSVYQSPER